MTSEGILVVDDEKMIVDLATKALARLGFVVTGCTDGFRALEMFAADPDAFDIVVTDQTMPHLTGFEMASKLLSIRPDLPIIMTTGYSDQLQDMDLSAAGICVLLPKPLKMRRLAEVIREMMNAETQV